ncbi:MAG: heparinase, partial [Bacteroidota bacterium]
YEQFRNPLLLDIFRVESDQMQQYDLPTWFSGHLLSSNFAYHAQTETRNTLGEAHGYQHLWLEAKGFADSLGNQITWFTHTEDGGGEVRGTFFTQTTSSIMDDELILARVGANDPNFNLRPDPVFIQRRIAKSTVFASVIESHGVYDPVSEIPDNPFGSVQSVEVLFNSELYTVIQVLHKNGTRWTVYLANEDGSRQTTHRLQFGNQPYEWEGPIHIERSFNQK